MSTPVRQMDSQGAKLRVERGVGPFNAALALSCMWVKLEVTSHQDQWQLIEGLLDWAAPDLTEGFHEF